jgi:hypothetical protein
MQQPTNHGSYIIRKTLSVGHAEENVIMVFQTPSLQQNWAKDH